MEMKKVNARDLFYALWLSDLFMERVIGLIKNGHYFVQTNVLDYLIVMEMNIANYTINMKKKENLNVK